MVLTPETSGVPLAPLPFWWEGWKVYRGRDSSYLWAPGVSLSDYVERWFIVSFGVWEDPWL